MKKFIYIFIVFISLIDTLKAETFPSAGLEIDQIQLISEKYRLWIIGSENIDYSNPLIQTRYLAILNYIRQANNKHDNFKYSADSTYNLTAKPGQKEVREILREILFPLCLGYQLPGDKKNPNQDYKNPFTLNKILFVFDYLRKKGWKKGLDMGYHYLETYEETGVVGYGGSMGNNVLPYGLSVFLMKDELSAKGLLLNELEMLDWVSDTVGPKSDYPVLWEETGFNCDAVRSMFNVRLCYILSLPKNYPGREKEMLYFQRLFDQSLQISNGWADLIKSDFLGYHHKGAYINAYAPNAFHTASLMVFLLNDSKYQIGAKAISNLSNAILTTRIFSNKYDVPRGLSGRFPTKLGTLQNNLPYFVYMANDNNPLQNELKSAFMRLWNPSNESFKTSFLKRVKSKIMYYGSMGALEKVIQTVNENIKPEKSPNGYWYYPYGGMTIYRQKEWMVSNKGVSKYIWDYESSGKENNYGRFVSAGVLRIYATGDPISAEDSGYKTEGWNWARLPGATTLDLEAEKLKSKSTRNFTSESFLGGVSVNANYGVSGLNYNDPLGDLKANKTVFFFEDYIVALGSDIVSEKEEAIVQTTVSQLAIDTEETNSLFDGKSIEGFNTEINYLKKEPVSYVDVKGHAYYVSSSDPILYERKSQTNPTHNGKAIATGNFETCRIIHGLNPEASNYQYVIKINGGNKGAKELAKSFKNKFEILQNDKIAHIVSYLPEKITGYAIRKSKSELKNDFILSSDTPCLVMLQEECKSTISLSIANPELGKIEKGLKLHFNDIKTRELWHAKSTIQPVRLTLKGNWSLSKNAQNVRILKTGKITVIEFDCFDGRTINTNLIIK